MHNFSDIVKYNKYFFIILWLFLVIRLPVFFSGSTKVIYLIGITIVLLLCVFTKQAVINKKYLMYFWIYSILIILSQLFWLDKDPLLSAHKVIFYQIYFILSFTLTWTVISTLDRQTFKKLTVAGIIFIICFLYLELFFRVYLTEIVLSLKSQVYNYSSSRVDIVLSQTERGLSFDNFYLFKAATFMALDTNYVANMVIPFFIILLYLKKEMKKSHYYILFFSFVFIIFWTISRAAWVAVFFLYLLSLFELLSPSLKRYIKFYIFISVPILSFVLLQYITSIDDESFVTKLQILKSLLKFSDLYLPTILFGEGNDLGYYIYSFKEGHYAHLTIPILLGVTGVLGTMVYFLGWFLVLKDTRYTSMRVFFVFILIGLSLGDPWEPNYMFACAIIGKLQLYRMDKEAV